MFSGGLDSILAIKVIQAQGLAVLGIHFISPFFGKPYLIDYWKESYGIDVAPVDIGKDYINLMIQGPEHGLGKVLNPCVDCKILMITKTRQLLSRFDAHCIITGEVLGQRPMSQRKDALNIIRRDSLAKDVLLRPLSAKHLDPTPMEQSGLVDRERLLGFWGRGRKAQIALAKEYGIKDIPTPAGGCLLTEKESSKRYWPLFKHHPCPTDAEFYLANIGRQFWNGKLWITIGKNKEDNEQLVQNRIKGDILFQVTNFPGPLALARPLPGYAWEKEDIKSGANLVGWYSPKARRSEDMADIKIVTDDKSHTVSCRPRKNLLHSWEEPIWEEADMDKKSLTGLCAS